MKSTVNVHHLNAFNIFSKRVRCTLITGFDITRSHLSNNGESKQQSLDGLIKEICRVKEEVVEGTMHLLSLVIIEAGRKSFKKQIVGLQDSSLLLMMPLPLFPLILAAKREDVIKLIVPYKELSLRIRPARELGWYDPNRNLLLKSNYSNEVNL
ncbi:hypothetical protein F2Q70_00004141 [Brassica cretica]|uniref:Uncharacterized protein n=1 Tax=Brassica cretica TaxID=69181 RepID=A0A8S9ISD6_BRACR|nr:hypothetical protein F2Q70_00004141 [Brassica cretica]